jgi:hypothetical protein
MAEEVIKHIKPDALFHHDDWGTQISTFMSPVMFEEFFLPAYKQVYGYYKKNGVEVIFAPFRLIRSHARSLYDRDGNRYLAGRHADKQPSGLIKKYGGQISIMGESTARMLTSRAGPERMSKER